MPHPGLDPPHRIDSPSQAAQLANFIIKESGISNDLINPSAAKFLAHQMLADHVIEMQRTEVDRLQHEIMRMAELLAHQGIRVEGVTAPLDHDGDACSVEKSPHEVEPQPPAYTESMAAPDSGIYGKGTMSQAELVQQIVNALRKQSFGPHTTAPENTMVTSPQLTSPGGQRAESMSFLGQKHTYPPPPSQHTSQDFQEREETMKQQYDENRRLREELEAMREKAHHPGEGGVLHVPCFTDLALATVSSAEAKGVAVPDLPEHLLPPFPEYSPQGKELNISTSTLPPPPFNTQTPPPPDDIDWEAVSHDVLNIVREAQLRQAEAESQARDAEARLERLKREQGPVQTVDAAVFETPVVPIRGEVPSGSGENTPLSRKNAPLTTPGPLSSQPPAPPTPPVASPQSQQSHLARSRASTRLSSEVDISRLNRGNTIENDAAPVTVDVFEEWGTLGDFGATGDTGGIKSPLQPTSHPSGSSQLGAPTTPIERGPPERTTPHRTPLYPPEQQREAVATPSYPMLAEARRPSSTASSHIQGNMAEPGALDSHSPPRHPSASPGASSAKRDDESLPPGWKEYKTPSGRPYYHNTKTGKSHWKRPTGEEKPLTINININVDKRMKKGRGASTGAPRSPSRSSQLQGQHTPAQTPSQAPARGNSPVAVPPSASSASSSPPHQRQETTPQLSARQEPEPVLHSCVPSEAAAPASLPPAQGSSPPSVHDPAPLRESPHTPPVVPTPPSQQHSEAPKPHPSHPSSHANLPSTPVQQPASHPTSHPPHPSQQGREPATETPHPSTGSNRNLPHSPEMTRTVITYEQDRTGSPLIQPPLNSMTTILVESLAGSPPREPRPASPTRIAVRTVPINSPARSDNPDRVVSMKLQRCVACGTTLAHAATYCHNCGWRAVTPDVPYRSPPGAAWAR